MKSNGGSRKEIEVVNRNSCDAHRRGTSESAKVKDGSPRGAFEKKFDGCLPQFFRGIGPDDFRSTRIVPRRSFHRIFFACPSNSVAMICAS
jgi:hypothetical protein